MKTNFITLLSTLLGKVVTNLAIYTVNSTCFLGLGQEAEPSSLNKYKKIK